MKTMTAMAVPKPGGPEAFVPQERPIPEPGTGEILVKVAAAGVNRPDVMQRTGLYPPPPGASDIPGLEIAGHVVSRGEGASRHGVGAPVCALLAGGGYAEYAVVHQDNALPVPKGLSMNEAACLPETYFTVWTNVFERGALKPGETLLVHGGSSGIGVTALQLAKAFGARVAVTAGSAEKCAACIALGADFAVDYRKQDFVAEIRAWTKGRGVDLVLDMVAGDYVPRNIEIAAQDGRIVLIALQRGVSTELDLRRILFKRLTLTGSTLRIRPVAEKAGIARAVEENVWPLLEKGQCKPPIFAVFRLDDVAKAHALMESSAHIGKIVLSVTS